MTTELDLLEAAKTSAECMAVLTGDAASTAGITTTSNFDDDVCDKAFKKALELMDTPEDAQAIFEALIGQHRENIIGDKKAYGRFHALFKKGDDLADAFGLAA